MSERNHPCEFCDTEEALEERLVTIYRHRKEQHFIFERVPARVCPSCGHKYFAWSVATEMDRLMSVPETLTHVQPVPVVALTN